MLSVSVTKNTKHFLYLFSSIKVKAMFFFTLSDELLFSPYCRGESLSFFREKLPSVLFNYYYYKRMSPKQHYSYFKIFQYFFHDSVYLDLFHPLPHTSLSVSLSLSLNTPIIKDKKVLSFSLLKLVKCFIHIFGIDIPVFFYNAINYILLNILKFLKGKFSQ